MQKKCGALMYTETSNYSVVRLSHFSFLFYKKLRCAVDIALLI